jgi:CO/xanthine dehydrogenase FAD-binding subunit
MAEQLNLAFFPSSYSELFIAWNRYPKAVPYAGGTALIRDQGKRILELPSIILSLEKLDDMRRISRSEHYMEIGAMAKLSRIIALGKIVPAVLRHCLKNIGGPQLRNMATIGGNLCFIGGCQDASAALMALDAQYELRNSQSSHWIAASRFFSASGQTVLKPQELLTRIRVPLDDWNYSIYQKFDGQGCQSNVVVFLARIQKNILNDIRIVCKTDMPLRNKESESLLAGKHLPLGNKIAIDFIESWKAFLSSLQNVDDLSRQKLINFIEKNIHNLSE